MPHHSTVTPSRRITLRHHSTLAQQSTAVYDVENEELFQQFEAEMKIQADKENVSDSLLFSSKQNQSVQLPVNQHQQTPFKDITYFFAAEQQNSSSSPEAQALPSSRRCRSTMTASRKKRHSFFQHCSQLTFHGVQPLQSKTHSYSKETPYKRQVVKDNEEDCRQNDDIEKQHSTVYSQLQQHCQNAADQVSTATVEASAAKDDTTDKSSPTVQTPIKAHPSTSSSAQHTDSTHSTQSQSHDDSATTSRSMISKTPQSTVAERQRLLQNLQRLKQQHDPLIGKIDDMLKQHTHYGNDSTTTTSSLSSVLRQLSPLRHAVSVRQSQVSTRQLLTRISLLSPGEPISDEVLSQLFTMPTANKHVDAVRQSQQQQETAKADTVSLTSSTSNADDILLTENSASQHQKLTQQATHSHSHHDNIIHAEPLTPIYPSHCCSLNHPMCVFVVSMCVLLMAILMCLRVEELKDFILAFRLSMFQQ